MATIEERDLLAERVLRPIGKNAVQLGEQEVTGFLAMTGIEYKRELMVVGRAVNGWTTGISPRELTDEQSIHSYAMKVYESVTSTASCPMKWVTDNWGNPDKDYNTKRSAFWQAIRAVVNRLGIADVDSSHWPSHLVWSNLYKVAPAGGGNPGGALCKIELSGCIELLQLEIAIYAPKRLLLLTGLDWAASFLTSPVPRVTPISGYSCVEGVSHSRGVAGEPKVVVGSHPQGKSRAAWVDEVCAVFEL